MRGGSRLILAALLAFVPRMASPQGNPLGPEFRVNTYTTGYQRFPSIAADSSGNFVVVWGSNQYGSTEQVWGQRYASSGSPLSPEFRVNTNTLFGTFKPSVALDASGDFVVVWDRFDGYGRGVFAQRYTSSGSPLGPEFRVNTVTAADQYQPSVAIAASGSFVVVWTSHLNPFDTDVLGQRFAGDGTPLGPEFRVNTGTASYQLYPSVAADSSGNFVVVWSSVSPDGVFGQRYASNGTPLGPEFRVNTYMTPFQFYPSVAADSSGNFVIVWQSAQDGSAVGVFGQRYASSGSPLGPEFRVNTYTTGAQRWPDVAADSLGNFVVAWTSPGQDGSSEGAFAQRYASSGMPLGPEFRANTFTPNSQGHPSVAADSSGDFVVVWHSLLQDGSDYGVYGQRYAQIVPVELIHYGVE